MVSGKIKVALCHRDMRSGRLQGRFCTVQRSFRPAGTMPTAASQQKKQWLRKEKANQKSSRANHVIRELPLPPGD
jgi:hypothetical protein